MFVNISNKISTNLDCPLKKSTKSPTSSTVSFPPTEWPSDVTVMGEPLFSHPLTSADLDALQESAGLGPPSWWLDIELARSSPAVSADTLSYEDGVLLTTLLRAPFEQAGLIRFAAGNLLDRINELEHLQTLSIKEGKRQRSGHQVTSRFASNPFDSEKTETDMRVFVENRSSDLRRKGTYVLRRLPLTVLSSLRPQQLQKEEVINTGLCTRPEQEESNQLEVCNIQRTFSKSSPSRLHIEGELQRSLDASVASSGLIDKPSQILSHTLDAEALGGVFANPQTCVGRLNTTQSPSPPAPPAELPQGEICQLAFSPNPTRGDTFVLCSSERPPAPFQLRDSFLTRTLASSSAPNSQDLKVNYSDHNVPPTSMPNDMNRREQEIVLLESSRCTEKCNVPLIGSITCDRDDGESENHFTESPPSKAINLSHLLKQSAIVNDPLQYDLEGQRVFLCESSRGQSSSQYNLKDSASLTEIRRTSGDQVIYGEEPAEEPINTSVFPTSVALPQHCPFNLDGSGDALHLNIIQASMDCIIQSTGVLPKKKSISSIIMSQTSHKNASSIHPPFSRTIDNGDATSDSLQTINFPGKYVQHLQAAKHAGIVVEARVVAMNSGTMPEQSIERPGKLQRSSQKLEKSSQSILANNSKDVIPNSQSMITGCSTAQCVTAIGSGGRAGRVTSLIRPPKILRSRLPIRTSITVTSSMEQLRSPLRGPRYRFTRDSRSVPSVTSRYPPP